MKYEQVRVELPPFISQHRRSSPWGGVSAPAGECVLAHPWRSSPGPEGWTQAAPACLWGRMRSKRGCAGVSEGRVLCMDKHNAWPRDDKARAIPIHTMVQTFTGAELF